MPTNGHAVEIEIPKPKRTALPFYALKGEGLDTRQISSWDGWAVIPTGDDEADYETGKSYAELAIKEAVYMHDLAPVTFTLATIYAKAHLAGRSDGAMERGFVDGVGRFACMGYRRRRT
jgi:hypothetical protein